MDDDLFDFGGGQETLTTISTKRKALDLSHGEAEPSKLPSDSTDPAPDAVIIAGDSKDESSSDEEDEKNGKDLRRPRKRRRGEPVPVVLDEIEIQANREIPVNPGLNARTEAEAGASLLLTHQVSPWFICHQWFAAHVSVFVGSTPSGCPARLSLCPVVQPCISA